MSSPAVPFGHPMREAHFSFAPSYVPLNHGSFGTFPKVVKDRQRELQDLTEARPDPFIRYELGPILDRSRAAAASILRVPTDELVFVDNATMGFNVILRTLVFEKGDLILHFSSIYGACEFTIDYICETTPAESVGIDLIYPIEDEDIVTKFKETVSKLSEAGKRVKIAVFDTVAALPGVRMPFELLVQTCKDLKILSLVDGAHGIGHLDLDLGKIGPDFFFSNCHK